MQGRYHLIPMILNNWRVGQWQLSWSIAQSWNHCKFRCLVWLVCKRNNYILWWCTSSFLLRLKKIQWYTIVQELWLVFALVGVCSIMVPDYWCRFSSTMNNVGTYIHTQQNKAQQNHVHLIMTSSNGNIFRVTGPLCGHRWIPRTKASDAELWCFLWFASE